MRLAAYSLLLLVACNSGEGDDYPVEPGGGGGGGVFGTTIGTVLDAPGNTDGGAMIDGRVCGLSEILRWNECDSIGMDGLNITLDGAGSTASDDGTFQIPAPVSTTAVWRVFGNAQVRSLRGFSGVNEIQSIKLDLYEETAADANVVIDNNVGTIFVQVLYAGAPVVGATAALAAPSAEFVYYDDASGSAAFSIGQTRANGLIWFPNVTPGAAVKFTVTPPAITGCTTCAPKETTVIVEADTATFATVVFP